MRVGHDEAVLREDEARPHARGPLFIVAAAVLARIAFAGTRRNGYAEAAEKLQHLLVRGVRCPATAYFFQCTDVDNRRPDLLDQLGEVRQTTHRRLPRLRLRNHRQ